MKRSRFTEEQIIGVLKDYETRAKTANMTWNTGGSGATVQLEGQIRWHGHLRGQTVEAARGEERQSEEGSPPIGSAPRPLVNCKKPILYVIY